MEEYIIIDSGGKIASFNSLQELKNCIKEEYKDKSNLEIFKKIKYDI